MKLAVSVQNRPGELELLPRGAGWRFRYASGGAVTEGEASVIEVEPGIYSVLWDGCGYEVKISLDKGKGFADIAGHHYAVEAADPRELAATAATGAAGREQVLAPMPGKVVRVLVAEGAEVAAGQGIVVVEAMKMQNEMPAPKAGRVVTLRATPGATVAAGELLAAIE
jgi:biotin carboxyl carrier protein